mgnify:CR=1 FL=1
MKYSKQNHTRQLKLFFGSAILPSKPTISLFTLPEDTQPGRINRMAKFKPFENSTIRVDSFEGRIEELSEKSKLPFNN